MNFATFTTKQQGPVLTVRFGHGDVNIMPAKMAVELFALAGQLAVDAQIKVLVFESANADFFIAHFDFEDLLKLIEGDASVPVSKDPRINVLQALGLTLQNLPQVTVAKVDGICRGGGFEFMLALDMCFASDSSKFCFPEAACGFLPAGGGATLLPFKTGKNRALEIMLTGRDFSGSEAQQYNFINRAFATTAELNDYVTKLVRQIASRDAAVIESIKSVSKTAFSAMAEDVLSGFAQENVVLNERLANSEVVAHLQKLAVNSGTRETELDFPAMLDAV